MDALKFSWSDLESVPTCLVSNLPYQISSSLVIEVSTVADSVEEMILMFQKEVAQKIKSQPGDKDYGILSVIAQSFWDVEKICDAAPACFYPAPKVASRVLDFRRKKGESFEHNTGR